MPLTGLIDKLAGILGAQHVSLAAADRELHGSDEGWHDPVAPEAVVSPATTAEVAEVVRLCAGEGVAVIPFGAGTSLEGHVAALHGGISLDLARMNQILEVNVDDLDVRVQAGVHRLQLNDRLRHDGLFFPIDPGADATIGGMTATRASGTNAVRYGTMRDAVMALTAVLGTGEIVRTGSRSRKSSAGYDLTRLLVGSEGTLGVITEIGLRVHGIPEVIGGATASFDSVGQAVTTVIQTIQLGTPVARIELLDAAMVSAVNAYSDLDLPVQPLLLLEFHGGPDAVAEQTRTVHELAHANGATDWQEATSTEERTRLWEARHNAYYASLALRPGMKGVPTDVCVPISQLAGQIDEATADIQRSGLTAPIVGHVGDGNFHVLIIFDPDDPQEERAALDFHDRLVHRGLAVGGTCTGEHGIGYGKLAYMSAEHDPVALATMRAIKHALDPQGVLNPGKVIPAA
ncbi:MAG: FAD-binding oxidoreductase [Euzebya sp.]